MRGIGSTFVLLLWIVGLAACGNGSTSAPGLGTIQVFNNPNSTASISVIEVTGPTNRSTGANIPPGGSYSMTNLLPGTYVVDLTWTDNATGTYTSVIVVPGGTTPLTGTN